MKNNKHRGHILATCMGRNLKEISVTYPKGMIHIHIKASIPEPKGRMARGELSWGGTAVAVSLEL
jgi:hypothetical protein